MSAFALAGFSFSACQLLPLPLQVSAFQRVSVSAFDWAMSAFALVISAFHPPQYRYGGPVCFANFSFEWVFQHFSFSVCQLLPL
jgi:hypothetical protein